MAPTRKERQSVKSIVKQRGRRYACCSPVVPGLSPALSRGRNGTRSRLEIEVERSQRLLPPGCPSTDGLSEVPLHSPPGGLLNIHALIKQFYRCYLPGDDKSTAPGRALHADKNLSVCVCTRARASASQACAPVSSLISSHKKCID